MKILYLKYSSYKWEQAGPKSPKVHWDFSKHQFWICKYAEKYLFSSGSGRRKSEYEQKLSLFCWLMLCSANVVIFLQGHFSSEGFPLHLDIHSIFPLISIVIAWADKHSLIFTPSQNLSFLF